MATSNHGGLQAAAAVFLFGAANGLVTVLRGVLPQQLYTGDAFAKISSQLASYGALGRALMPVVAAQALALQAGLATLSAVYCIAVVICGWALWRQVKQPV